MFVPFAFAWVLAAMAAMVAALPNNSAVKGPFAIVGPLSHEKLETQVAVIKSGKLSIGASLLSSASDKRCLGLTVCTGRDLGGHCYWFCTFPGVETYTGLSEKVFSAKPDPGIHCTCFLGNGCSYRFKSVSLDDFGANFYLMKKEVMGCYYCVKA